MLTIQEIIDAKVKNNVKPGEEDLRKLPYKVAFLYGRVSKPKQIRNSKESIREIASLVDLAKKDGFQTNLNATEIERLLLDGTIGVWEDGYVIVDVRDLGISGQLSADERKGLEFDPGHHPEAVRIPQLGKLKPILLGLRVHADRRQRCQRISKSRAYQTCGMVKLPGEIELIIVAARAIDVEPSGRFAGQSHIRTRAQVIVAVPHIRVDFRARTTPTVHVAHLQVGLQTIQHEVGATGDVEISASEVGRLDEVIETETDMPAHVDAGCLVPGVQGGVDRKSHVACRFGRL